MLMERVPAGTRVVPMKEGVKVIEVDERGIGSREPARVEGRS